MKLLVVTQTIDKNDPALGFFHQWIEEFSKKFESITVIALNVGEHSLPQNVTVHSLGKSEGKGRITRGVRFWKLLFSLRAKYDVVFCHMNPEYMIAGGLLWRLLGKKTALWYMHGVVSPRLHLAVFLADRVLTGSKESCRIESNKVQVLGHGIDVDVFSPGEVAQEPLSLISVGRLSPSKRVETFLSVCEMLSQKGITYRARVIGGPATKGDEVYAETLRVRAEKLPSVLFLGPVPHHELPDFFRDSHLCISASTTGSLDKVMLEAMASGVIPITSNRAFERALSSQGLYVSAGPEEFFDILVSLWNDAPRRKQLRTALRNEVVSKHSLRSLVEKIYSTYEHI